MIDEYYLEYTNLFQEVKNYEYFKDLHLRKISPIKRKSLLKVAKGVSIKSGQSLHNFITNLNGSVNKWKSRRLDKIKKQNFEEFLLFCLVNLSLVRNLPQFDLLLRFNHSGRNNLLIKGFNS